MSIAQKISVVKRNFGHPIISSTMCLGGGVEDYGARIRQAYRDWHAAHDPDVMSWAEVTRRVARLLKKPETSVAVLKWKDGLQEPTIGEFRAVADVLETDPAVLAFGRGEEERAYVKPHPLKPPKELDGPAKSTRRKGNG